MNNDSLLEQDLKSFPPGRSLLRIPVSSRRAALAGLALYAPCRRRSILAQRLAWIALGAIGPLALPGRRRPWRAPFDAEVGAELIARWRQLSGAFDAMAVHERNGAHRGLCLLLLLRGQPVAFVKLREGDAASLRNEREALDRISAFDPRSFSCPLALAEGACEDWNYLVLSPLPATPHLPDPVPPLSSISSEIQNALADFPRPDGTPRHWLPMHGDLTPWNLRRFRRGSLVLMDWEDAGWGPPGADEVLYRAASLALTNTRATAGAPEEAVVFSRRRVQERTAATSRDRRLRDSLTEALDGMFTASGRGDDP